VTGPPALDEFGRNYVGFGVALRRTPGHAWCRRWRWIRSRTRHAGECSMDSLTRSDLFMGCAGISQGCAGLGRSQVFPEPEIGIRCLFR
jgi:hypothetical protein